MIFKSQCSPKRSAAEKGKQDMQL